MEYKFSVYKKGKLLFYIDIIIMINLFSELLLTFPNFKFYKKIK